ncbi:plexin-B3 [Platysternon megacephalum]|uniref:Plexin-B3 n=1 Tax=Platysternon megacephalum TaxID=55544 RepID=A0A4D9DCS5_9SAUR|nr:plexin-B3 [Platysternon megacephalum]
MVRSLSGSFNLCARAWPNAFEGNFCPTSVLSTQHTISEFNLSHLIKLHSPDMKPISSTRMPALPSPHTIQYKMHGCNSQLKQWDLYRCENKIWPVVVATV